MVNSRCWVPGILACIDEQNTNLFLDMSNGGIFLFFYSISIMEHELRCRQFNEQGDVRIIIGVDTSGVRGTE